MRRACWLVLMLLGFCPQKTTAQTRTQVDSATAALSAEVETLRRENSRLRSSVDTLTTLLREHTVEEGFYEASLGEQANRFALIIAGLLSLIGLISYGGFRFEIMRQKAEMEENLRTLDARYLEMQTRVRESEQTLYSTAGNVSRLVSDYALRNRGFAHAALYNLRAALAFFQLHAIDQAEKSKRVGLENLELAESHLSRLPVEDQSVKHLERIEEDVNKLIAELIAIRDSAVLDEIVNIRIQLRRIKAVD